MDNRIYLNKTIDVKIDRPIGSSHPNYPDHIYLVNYGYVPNTISGDGEEIDCYILGEYKPLKDYRGTCIAIIHRLEEDDDKLIIVPENKNYTNSEIRLLTNFQEKFYKSEIIRSPNYLEFNKNIPELSVTNLENSLNFYKTAGFKVEYDRLENKFAFISLGEIQFMLQEIAKNNKWDIAPLTYPFGNGIGKLLLKKIEEYFKSIDCKRINIEVFGPNKRGLNFYEKNGYIIRDIIVAKKI